MMTFLTTVSYNASTPVIPVSCCSPVSKIRKPVVVETSSDHDFGADSNASVHFPVHFFAEKLAMRTRSRRSKQRLSSTTRYDSILGVLPLHTTRSSARFRPDFASQPFRGVIDVQWC